MPAKKLKRQGTKKKCLACDNEFTPREKLGKLTVKYCSTECSLKQPKANSGRPTVVTPAVIRKLEEVFGIGGSDGEACFYASISKTAFYEYCQKNPAFAEKKEQLKERPILKARQELIKGLTGNPELALKYLERKKKAEFSTKIEQELTGKDGGAIEQEVTIKTIFLP